MFGVFLWTPAYMQLNLEHLSNIDHRYSCQDYVVDPLAEGMWDSMPLLRGPFGDSSILKVHS